MRYFLFLILPALLFGVIPVAANNFQAFIDNDIFYSPQEGPYVETHILIPGGELIYKINNKKDYQATVEVTITISRDGDIVAFEKYLLNSLNLKDSTLIQDGLIDQKRFLLEPGAYVFDAKFTDFHNPENTFSFNEPVIIDDFSEEIRISDIEPVEKFEQTEIVSPFYKNGFMVVPYVLNYFPGHVNKLTFYAEIYNTGDELKEDAFAVKYFIEEAEGNKSLNDYGRIQKYETGEVRVVLNAMDISTLPTGNYNLVIQARNKENELLAEKKFYFQRSKIAGGMDYAVEGFDVSNTFAGKIGNADIDYQLKSLYPIASRIETSQLSSLIKGGSLESKQKFLYWFWKNRNQEDPSLAWYAYSEKVKEVNDAYSTAIEYGFETDRGRVYLQYGAANQILKAPREPGGKPYEVWHYYTLGNQRDVRFVFANFDLVSNNYDLIHSTATGELSNPKWKTVIYEEFENLNDGSRFERTNRRGHYGSRSDDFFDE